MSDLKINNINAVKKAVREAKEAEVEDRRDRSDLERIGRKVLRTADKIVGISKDVSSKTLKRVAKAVSWQGSVRRTNHCIKQGKGAAKCVIAETANQLVRKGAQAVGTVAMVGGVPLMAAPTGITQIGGAALITSGAAVVYDADEYENQVARMIESIDMKMDRAVEAGKAIKERSADIKRKWERCEAVPEEHVDTKTLFTKYHTNYFDGAASNGYMSGVPQIRSESKPHIEIIPRLPNVSIKSMDDMTFSVGMSVAL